MNRFLGDKFGNRRVLSGDMMMVLTMVTDETKDKSLTYFTLVKKPVLWDVSIFSFCKYYRDVQILQTQWYHQRL